MSTFLSLTALYLFVVIGAGEFLACRPWAVHWLPAGDDIVWATLRLKSVNWNGDDGKTSGGK